MMTISKRLTNIKKSIPENVQLVAVSKTKPIEDILEAYKSGQRIFGENKIQEMTDKWESLPKDIEWHMIGHVQTNKVKYMAPFVTLIHGVDSLKLLQEINKQAVKNKRIIDCLLQVHIAEEESKFGFSETEIEELLKSKEIKTLNNIRIRGLMGMATFTENSSQIRKEFKTLKRIFEQATLLDWKFDTLSMGMSGDYEIAIEEGSNMIRIGSNIFGNR